MTPEEELATHERLKRLEEEEQAVSKRRRLLHERMAMFPDIAESRAQEEQELSTRRRELHLQIDDLRSRLGFPPVGH